MVKRRPSDVTLEGSSQKRRRETADATNGDVSLQAMKTLELNGPKSHWI